MSKVENKTTETGKEPIKNELTAKSISDQYLQTFESEATNLMGSMGFDFKAETKKAMFNIIVACTKTLKDKGITWDHVNKDGLASKMLDYALLELNPANKELYIIPYTNKNGKYDLEFEESYRGARKKAKKFSIDNLIDMPAYVIREGDKLESKHDLLNGDTVIYEPLSFNTNKVIGAFCYLKFEDKSKNKIVEMSLDELNKVKKASEDKMGGKTSPAWKNWESEMQKKAVIKRAAKEIEIDVPVEFQQAYTNTEKTIMDAEFEEKPTPQTIELTTVTEKDTNEETVVKTFDEETGEVKDTEIPEFE